MCIIRAEKGNAPTDIPPVKADYARYLRKWGVIMKKGAKKSTLILVAVLAGVFVSVMVALLAIHQIAIWQVSTQSVDRVLQCFATGESTKLKDFERAFPTDNSWIRAAAVEYAAKKSGAGIPQIMEMLRRENISVSYTGSQDETLTKIRSTLQPKSGIQPKSEVVPQSSLLPATVIGWGCCARYGLSANYQMTHDMSHLTFDGK